MGLAYHFFDDLGVITSYYLVTRCNIGGDFVLFQVNLWRIFYIYWPIFIGCCNLVVATLPHHLCPTRGHVGIHFGHSREEEASDDGQYLPKN